MSRDKIWLITRGCYSDYEVIGFSYSKEDAEKLCVLKGADDVEECSLLKLDSDISIEYGYMARFSHMEDGWRIRDLHKINDRVLKKVPPKVSFHEWGEIDVELYLKEKNEEMARKIAQDELYKFLSEKITYDELCKFLAEKKGL